MSDLIGRCFHVFGQDREVQYQGRVQADLGAGYYLVQYFDWIIGEPSTMAIVHIQTMVQSEPRRGEGAWQFYEDEKHLTHWYDNYGK